MSRAGYFVWINFWASFPAYVSSPPWLPIFLCFDPVYSLMAIHLLCIIVGWGVMYAQLCTMMVFRSRLSLSFQCNPNWLVLAYYSAVFVRSDLSMQYYSTIAAMVDLWLSGTDWFSLTLLLIIDLCLACSSMLWWDGAFVYAFTLCWLKSYFPLGSIEGLAGHPRCFCIISPCLFPWIVQGFLLVVLDSCSCFIPPLYHKIPLAVHLYFWPVTDGWTLVHSSFPFRMWLLYLFLVCGLLITVAFSFGPCCLLFKWLHLFYFFSHKLPSFVCFKPPAICYNFGVWILASGMHTVFCWFGMIRMMGGFHRGSCVAGLLTFRQPHLSMAVPKVYDVDDAFLGISETKATFCFLLVVRFILYGIITLLFTASARWIWIYLTWELSLVSGHEEFFFWPETSLWNSLCCIDSTLAKCLVFPLENELVFCGCCYLRRAVLQKLKSCWHLFHFCIRNPLVTIFRIPWGLYLLHTQTGFFMQLRKWLLEDEASLYPEQIFQELYFHYMEENTVVTSTLPSPHMLKRTIPLCFLPPWWECIVVAYLWYQLVCKSRHCLLFRSTRVGLYVTDGFSPVLITLLHRALSTVGTRYDMLSYFLLMSRSMVRGHKTQVLWLVASPLTFFFGHYYRCIVTKIVRTTHFLLWYGCHGLFKLISCPWYLCSFLFMLNLPPQTRIELSPVTESLNDVPLQQMGLTDSFELISTFIGQFPPFFYL